MSQFHKEEDHKKGFALLFDSHNVEVEFNKRVQGTIRYTIIKDKEEQRISSMLHSAGEIGRQFIHLQTSAISAVAMAKSADEADLMALGLIPVIPSGVAVCPTCLAKAILTCEENLAVLKDIQEATKRYAT